MHELTNKILYDKGNWDDADKLVREWLGEKAKEITKAHYEAWENPRALNVIEILGLSDSSSPEPHSEAICTNNGRNSCIHTPKPSETKKEWCNHQIFHDGAWWHFDIANNTEEITPDQWDICPVKGCHTPRPKELSLEERVAEAIDKELVRQRTNCNAWDTKAMARAAIQEINKNEKI